MAWFECNISKGKPFIASTNAQQLNLPIYMDENIVIKTKVLVHPLPQGETSIINNEWNVYSFAFYTSNKWLVLRDATNHTVNITNQSWRWVDIEFNTSDGSLKYDGVTYGGAGGTYNHKVISLFGVENSHFSNVAFQDIEIYKNGTLYMNLIPKQDTNTGAGYFHDTINGNDYYSATQTALVYGEF